MQKYNTDLMEFFLNKNIDYKKIKNNPEAIMRSKREIDRIVYQNGQYKNEVTKEISIADLIGSAELNSKNILDNMNELYNSDGGKYEKRNLENLYITNPIEFIIESCFDDPIYVEEISKGKYIISNNGRHRCNLLRLYYLNELQNCNNEEEKNNLKNKYKIPVRAKDIDVVKTYSKYLLNKISNFDEVIYQEIDNCNGTGKIIIEDEEGNKKYFDNNELVEYVKTKISELSREQLENEIPQAYNSNIYFQEFVNIYFKDTEIFKGIDKWYDKNVSIERRKSDV